MLLLAPPLLLDIKKRQLFLSSSESGGSGQRLPKINSVSVQPQGWVRVTLHDAHSLIFLLPVSKHGPLVMMKG